MSLVFGVWLGGSTALAAPLDEALKPLPGTPVLDAARVELGRRLFNETRLSINNTRSCA
ncbi:cytochrome c peroxidase, partial [Pseudomonas shahriarae]|uniref:cytochrome c peroxidase n=1 Tax=Pseudomonas shahriarae TaxID=2745512 RepID=UPI0023748268|nr:cytochrome B6 [Pseudomonas shahriarae]